MLIKPWCTCLASLCRRHAVLSSAMLFSLTATFWFSTHHTAQAAEAGSALRVSVTLAEALQNQARPDDTLFVYARAAAGPRMPLAIVRLRAADLPATVTLDDSSAMTPAMKLSNFEEVIVMARISRSGDAMTRSGDLLASTAEPVRWRNSTEVKLVIESQVP